MDTHIEQLSDFNNWYPISLTETPTLVHWKKFVRQHFTQPFFFDEFTRTPKNHTKTTPLSSLKHFTAQHSLPLSALIFHVSRCGSTLMTQQLRQSDRCLVISEPSIIESVLSYSRNLSSEAERIMHLQSAIYALGRPQNTKQTHFIIKLDCWHIADLPLFRKAFPNTPLFCLYRNPVEVFQSHQKIIGQQMVPGLIDSSALSLDLTNIKAYQLDLYSLQVLERIYAFVLKYAKEEQLKLINYKELPEITINAFVCDIALRLTEKEYKSFSSASNNHSKYNTPFVKETGKNQRTLAAYEKEFSIINNIYNELKEINHRQD